MSTIGLPPGVIFHGRYEIGPLLGRGGMGMVHSAHDRVLDERVAIKILRPEFAQDRSMADRFRSEIKLARHVRHRNVCAIHDYGEEGDLLFISMEYVDGVDLKRLLRDSGPLPPDQAYDLAIQVAEGLQAVHDAGIVHRDLKTPNVMLDREGRARLMDFGIAKRLGQETLTAAGQIVGTPEYMSPEQARGEKVDARSDLYALGVLTFEVFTGQVPFRGDRPVSTILKHLLEPPPLDGPEAARLPPALRSELRRVLAKAPHQRHASAREMAEALRRARSEGSRAAELPARQRAPARDAAPRTRALAKRPPLASWPARVTPLLLASTCALGGALLWWRQPSAQRAVPPAAPRARLSFARPEPSAPAPAPSVTTHPAAPPPMIVGPRAASRTPSPAARPRTPSATPPSIITLPPPPATIVDAEPDVPAAPGLLQIAVLPWAEVAIDGTVVGSTPLEKLILAPGSHTLRLRHPAYGVVQRTVVMRPGQLERVVVDLTR